LRTYQTGNNSPVTNRNPTTGTVIDPIPKVGGCEVGDHQRAAPKKYHPNRGLEIRCSDYYTRQKDRLEAEDLEESIKIRKEGFVASIHGDRHHRLPSIFLRSIVHSQMLILEIILIPRFLKCAGI
jgi:hypothetical protein